MWRGGERSDARRRGTQGRQTSTLQRLQGKTVPESQSGLNQMDGADHREVPSLCPEDREEPRCLLGGRGRGWSDAEVQEGVGIIGSPRRDPGFFFDRCERAAVTGDIMNYVSYRIVTANPIDNIVRGHSGQMESSQMAMRRRRRRLTVKKGSWCMCVSEELRKKT